MTSIGIIGGGLVGLATAFKLTSRLPRAAVTVFEKEDSFGRHQSTHNSGVLHAGLYYKPGSAKARLAVDGLRQMLAFCSSHAIPHEQCGKLVVATDSAEAAQLKTLLDRGRANGLRGLRLLGPEEMREREPHARGVAAILVPEEGIVDYAAVVRALEAELRQAGCRLLTDWNIRQIERRGSQWRLTSARGEETCEFIINAAGLHCDRVSRLAGQSPVTRIVPFRGEYYKLAPGRQRLVRHLIYPTPNPRFPFLGVHFTRLIGGGVEAGPNAVLALSREGYTWSDINLRDLAASLLFPGLWRFGAAHWRMCLAEIRQSLSKRRFVEALQKLVPEIQADDLRPGGAGVRAQAMQPDGALVNDFCFARAPGALHVLNAPSPAATASLAIADEVVAQALPALA